MLIDQASIRAMAQQVFRKAQGRPDKRLMHPVREWGIGLVLFAVMVSWGGWYAGMQFIHYRALDTSPSAVHQPVVPTYNTSLVNTALSIYRARAAAYQALLPPGAATMQLPPMATSSATTVIATSSSASKSVGTPQLAH